MSTEERKQKLFQLAYDPKEDITTWELAQVIAFNMQLETINHPIPEDALSGIQGRILRHYHMNDVTEEFSKLLADEATE